MAAACRSAPLPPRVKKRGCDFASSSSSSSSSDRTTMPLTASLFHRQPRAVMPACSFLQVGAAFTCAASRGIVLFHHCLKQCAALCSGLRLLPRQPRRILEAFERHLAQLTRNLAVSPAERHGFMRGSTDSYAPQLPAHYAAAGGVDDGQRLGRADGHRVREN